MTGRKRRPEDRGRSGYERKVMEYLESQGVEYGYETDYVHYTVPETKRRYIPDFRIGNTFIESKGLFTAAERKKMKLVLEQNPDLKIKMLFQRDNAIRRGSKTKYSTWCIKHGIDFAISPKGTVPARWITG